MYLCRLSSFQKETERKNILYLPADVSHVLWCRFDSRLSVDEGFAFAGHHVGIDFTFDIFTLQYADYEDFPADQYTGQPGGIGISGRSKQFPNIV